MKKTLYIILLALCQLPIVTPPVALFTGFILALPVGLR